MTPILLLGPPHDLTMQWLREITSLDSNLRLPDQTEVQTRTDLKRKKSFAFKSQLIRTAALLSMLLKTFELFTLIAVS